MPKVEDILSTHVTQIKEQARVKRTKELMLDNAAGMLGIPRPKFSLRKLRRNPLKRLQTKSMNPYYRVFIDQWSRQQTIFCHHRPQNDIDYQEVNIYFVIFDPKMEHIITGGSDGLIKIFKKQTGKHLRTLKGHLADISILTISPTSNYIASFDDSGMVRIWKFPSGEPVAVLKESERKEITSLFFHEETYKDGSKKLFFVVCAAKHGLFIYKEEDFKDNNGVVNPEQRTVNLTAHLREAYPNLNFFFVEVSQKGVLSAYSNSGYIFLWTQFSNIFRLDGTFNASPQKQIEGIHSNGKTSVEINWSPNSQFLSNSNEKEAIIIERLKDNGGASGEARYVKIGSLVNNLTIQHRRRTNKSSISILNDNYFVSCFNVRSNSTMEQSLFLSTIYIFSLKLKTIIHKITNSSSSASMDVIINGLSFHPSLHNVFVSVDINGQIIIWDCLTGTPLRIFYETGLHINQALLPAQLWDCCFSEDGKQLLVSSSFGTFTVYGYGTHEFSDHISYQQFGIDDQQPFTLIPDTMDVLDHEGNLWKENIDTVSCNLKLNIHDTWPEKNETPSRRHQLEWVWKQKKKVKEELRKFKENDKTTRNEEKTRLFNDKIKEGLIVSRAEENLLKKIKDFYKNPAAGENVFEPGRNTPTQPTAPRRRVGRPPRNRNPDQQDQQQRERTAGQYGNDSFLSDDTDSFQNAVHEEEDFEMASNPSITSDHFEFDNEDDNDDDEDEEDSRYPQRRRSSRINLRRNRTHAARVSGSRRLNFNNLTSQSNHQRNRRSQRQSGNMMLRRRAAPSQLEGIDDVHGSYNSTRRTRRLLVQENDSFEQNQISLGTPEQSNLVEINDVVCSNCSQTGATEECYGDECQKIFHANICKDLCCQTLRNSRNSELYCFECLNKAIHQRAEEQGWVEYNKIEVLSRQWLNSDSFNVDINLPQIGDTYYFIPKAYQQFISKAFRVLGFSQEETIYPQDKLDRQNPSKLGWKCKVTDISFEFPNIDAKYVLQRYRKYLTVVCKITLETLDTQQETFQVRYFPSEDPFLIWHYYFEQKLEQIKKLKKNSRFTVGQSVYLSEQDFSINNITSIYKCVPGREFYTQDIGVTTRRQGRGTTDEMIQDFSPWEIALDSRESSIGFDEGIRDTLTSLDNEQKKHCLKIVEELIRDHKKLFNIFIGDVDKNNFSNYLEYVQVEMNIIRIKKRLQNDFYRSMESLFFDIDLISKNSLSFNGEDPQVTPLSRNLVKYLKFMMKNETENAVSILEEIKNSPDLPSGLLNDQIGADDSSNINNDNRNRRRRNTRVRARGERRQSSQQSIMQEDGDEESYQTSTQERIYQDISDEESPGDEGSSIIEESQMTRMRTRRSGNHKSRNTPQGGVVRQDRNSRAERRRNTNSRSDSNTNTRIVTRNRLRREADR